MGWIKNLVRDQPFQSDLERQYSVKFLRDRELTIAQQHLYCTLGWAFAGSAIFGAAFGWTSALAIESYLVHLAFFVWSCLVTYFRGRDPRLKHSLFWINSLCDAYWMAMMMRVDATSTGFKFLTALVIVQGSVSLILLPYRSWIHAVTLATYVTSFSAVAIILKIDPVVLTVVICLYWLSSNVQTLMHRNRRHALIAEFRDKARYIPLQLIRRSLADDSSLASIYPQEERFCLCLSSDWRGFQKTARQLAPNEIGRLLAAYYDQVSALLERHFPDGNYFYDWIADELFCVIFSGDDHVNPDLTRNGIAFARELLTSRAAFCDQYGAPHGIDIGASAGVAVIGVFGPRGQGKATAFGEVPGLSRRIQALGKMLRTQFGDADRIIFGESVVAHLTKSAHLQTFDAPPNTVRDVTETKFHFITAESAGLPLKVAS